MKTFTTLFVTFCMIATILPLQADADQGVEKLKLGAIQFVTAPLAVGEKTSCYANEYQFPLGVVAGILGGVGAMINQGAEGFINMVTFPWDTECLIDCDY